MTKNAEERLFGLEEGDLYKKAESKLESINLRGVDKEGLTKRLDELTSMRRDKARAFEMAKSIWGELTEILKENEDVLRRAQRAAALSSVSKISWEGGGGIAHTSHNGISVTGRDGGTHFETQIVGSGFKSSEALTELSRSSSKISTQKERMTKEMAAEGWEGGAMRMFEILSMLPTENSAQPKSLIHLVRKSFKESLEGAGVNQGIEVFMSWLDKQTSGALMGAVALMADICNKERESVEYRENSRYVVRSILDILLSSRYKSNRTDEYPFENLNLMMDMVEGPNQMNWELLIAELDKSLETLESQIPRQQRAYFEDMARSRQFENMPPHYLSRMASRMGFDMLDEMFDVDDFGFNPNAPGRRGGMFEPPGGSRRGYGNMRGDGPAISYLLLRKARVEAETALRRGVSSKFDIMRELGEGDFQKRATDLRILLARSVMGVADGVLEEMSGWLREEGLTDEETVRKVLMNETPLDIAFDEILNKGPDKVWEKWAGTTPKIFGTLRETCGVMGVSSGTIDELNRTGMGEALVQAGRDILKDSKDKKTSQSAWVGVVMALVHEMREPSELSEMSREEWVGAIKKVLTDDAWGKNTSWISDLITSWMSTTTKEGLTEEVLKNLGEDFVELARDGNEVMRGFLLRAVRGESKEGDLRRLDELRYKTQDFLTAKPESVSARLREVTEDQFRIDLVWAALMTGKTNVRRTPNQMLADGMEHAMSITGLNKKALVTASAIPEIWNLLMERVNLKSIEMHKVMTSKPSEEENKNEILRDCMKAALRRGLPMEAAMSAMKAMTAVSYIDLGRPVSALSRSETMATLSKYLRVNRSTMDFVDDMSRELELSRSATEHWREEITQWAAHLMTESDAETALENLKLALRRVDDWRQAEAGGFMKKIGTRFTWRNLNNGERRWHDEIASAQGMNVSGEVEWEPVVGDLTIGSVEAVELCSERMLVNEGRAMHHCVGGYAAKCQEGMRIFSLREDGKRLATLSMSLSKSSNSFTINQNLASYNRPPVEKAESAAQVVLRLANEKMMEGFLERKARAAYRLTSTGDVEDSISSDSDRGVTESTAEKVRKAPKMC